MKTISTLSTDFSTIYILQCGKRNFSQPERKSFYFFYIFAFSLACFLFPILDNYKFGITENLENTFSFKNRLN